MQAAPETPWFDALRDMRTVQQETMRESAQIVGWPEPVQGIYRGRHVDRDAFGVPVNDAYARFSITETDAADLSNSDQIVIRGTTYTIVDTEADSGVVHLRLESY